jgi:hypothetical protein
LFFLLPFHFAICNSKQFDKHASNNSIKISTMFVRASYIEV